MPRARAGTDVVVVGGGIIGCACAIELAGHGVSVTLLERAELAAGASGRNHGLLLTPLDPALSPMAVWDLYEEAALDPVLSVRLDAEPIGFLIVAGEDENERRAAREEADAAATNGVQVEWLDGRGAIELEPTISPEISEGWLLNDGRRVDPASLTVELALRARSLGADVRRNVTVRGFLRRGQAVRGVVTDDGAVEADAVVVAAGPWSPSLLRRIGIHSPIVGFRGWLVQVAPHRETVRHLVGRGGWHTLPGHESVAFPRASDLLRSGGEPLTGALVQPNPDGTVLLGGSRQAAVMNEPEDPSTPGRIVQLGTALVPALADADLLAAWWGLRPMTPDGRPIVGFAEEGLLVASGHGSQGVILGAGTARLVASMVLDEPPPFDPSPFRPGRFGRGPG